MMTSSRIERFAYTIGFLLLGWSLLAQASLFVGADSGVMHMAAAMKTPLVALLIVIADAIDTLSAGGDPPLVLSKQIPRFTRAVERVLNHGGAGSPLTEALGVAREAVGLPERSDEERALADVLLHQQRQGQLVLDDAAGLDLQGLDREGPAAVLAQRVDELLRFGEIGYGGGLGHFEPERGRGQPALADFLLDEFEDVVVRERLSGEIH